MKLRIRTKFLGILLLAAVLPLGLALIVAETLGFRYYQRAQGRLLQSRAEDLAHSLSLAVGAQLASLNDWIALSEIPARVAAAGVAQPRLGDAEFRQHIAATEAGWPGLAADAAPIRGLLQNDIATGLRAFQKMHPLFVELLATDARGQLVAATSKTSDFWQADEAWWQRAFEQRWSHVYVEGIHYDESARVYSVDVAVPIRDWRMPGAPPVGVIKGVINASPLLSSAPKRSGEIIGYQVVLADGRILARLSGPKVDPLKERLPAETVAKLQQKRTGWLLGPLNDGVKSLAGFAPLRLSETPGEDLEVTGLTPMKVLVFNSADIVFAPARRQVWIVGGVGTLLILASAFLGYWLAGKKIIAPLEALRTAARAIGATAKLGDAAPELRPLPALEPIRRIRTGDELQDLAHEFEYMAGRVLTYSERLESDLAAKTAAIDADLQMAREFQQALMPHAYPKVPGGALGAKVGLEFHHIYRPASSVGGDFFDVLKLSDHRAGVFIADVMGHGARSALVTAILRALLQNLAGTTADPAQFLARLNEHFYEIVRQSDETIFVSAFYIVIDTATATASYASAGHPSPFVADRVRRRVLPLFDSLRANPALGLFPRAAYDQWTRLVQPGDVFLLFTDGVHEAYNATGEEFGLERLRALIAGQLTRPSRELSQTVVDAVLAFIQPATPADDICLVTVEVTPAPAPATISPTQISKAQ